MKIGIIGGGTVGRATARAWQEHCEEVRVFDVIKERANSGLYETLDCELIFICFPESQIDDFFREASHRGAGKLNFVLKSTVPIGTTRRLAEEYGLPNLVHSPEFLTERCSIWDAQNPARVIIGSPKGPSTLGDDNKCYDLYFDTCQDRFPSVPIFNLSSDESELVKLACNAFAATKVALFNEFRSLTDKLGLDWKAVREGVLGDGRIGNAWTAVPGPDGKRGFGGKCLPKDLEMLIDCFKSAGLGQGWLLAQVLGANDHYRSQP